MEEIEVKTIEGKQRTFPNLKTLDTFTWKEIHRRKAEGKKKTDNLFVSVEVKKNS